MSSTPTTGTPGLPDSTSKPDLTCKPLSGPSPSESTAKPAYSKRGKITIVACVNCRRRKTKCDGQRPVCSQCRARDGQCHYDMNEDQRRLTFLRENVEHLHGEKSSLESLIWNLRISTEQEALNIIRRLRGGTDPHALAQTVQAGRALAQVSRPGTDGMFSDARSSSLGPDVYQQLLHALTEVSSGESDEVIRRLRLHEDPGTILGALMDRTLLRPLIASGEYSASEQTFGLTRMDPNAKRESESSSRTNPAAYQVLTLQGNKSSQWTNVPDTTYVNMVISLYFVWQSCFFQNVPQKLFNEDMNAGSSQYCSRMLLNAICAAGCWLAPNSDPAAGIASAADKITRDRERSFFDQALEQLNTNEEYNLTTVASLCIMSTVEGNRGRMRQAWDYCGRSSRLALDLNIHRRDYPTKDDSMKMAQSHVFWGAFISDQVMSFTLGRVPQIPLNAITIPLPQVITEDDELPWEPYGDGAHSKHQGARSTTFHEVASLSRIINSTLSIFFAPSQTLNGSLILDEFVKYQVWYSRLPAIVQLHEDPLPHVLSLHMYYHAAVLLLFRPFLHATFTSPSNDVDPGSICRIAASAISKLFEQHWSTYKSVGMYTIQIHCLLAACSIHILNLPAISSTGYLCSAADRFHRLAPFNGWAESSINSLKRAVTRNNIILPSEVEQALYQDVTPAHEVQGLSHGNFGKRVAHRGMTPPAHQKKPRLAVPNAMAENAASQSKRKASSRNDGAIDEGRQTNQQVLRKSSSIKAEALGGLPSYLFAPLPNHPGLLLSPVHTSDGDMHDRTTKGNVGTVESLDGLTFESGPAWSDPFMGFEELSSWVDVNQMIY